MVPKSRQQRCRTINPPAVMSRSRVRWPFSNGRTSTLDISYRSISVVVVCAGIAGVAAAGCGAAQHSSSGAEKTETSAGELAQHSILLRSYLGHGWTDAGPANDVVLSACSTSSIRAGLNTHADSHAFAFGRSFKLATSSYVYANRAEARRAVSGFTATTMLSCIARTGTSSIRSAHYVTGPPHISQTSTLAAGEVARRFILKSLISTEVKVFCSAWTSRLSSRAE